MRIYCLEIFFTNVLVRTSYLTCTWCRYNFCESLVKIWFTSWRLVLHTLHYVRFIFQESWILLLLPLLVLRYGISYHFLLIQHSLQYQVQHTTYVSLTKLSKIRDILLRLLVQNGFHISR